MKWILLIFAPFIVGLSALVAFSQPLAAEIWILLVATSVAAGVWYYEKHHQVVPLDTWEVSEEQWQETLARYVKKAKQSDEKSSNSD